MAQTAFFNAFSLCLLISQLLSLKLSNYSTSVECKARNPEILEIGKKIDRWSINHGFAT